MSRSPQGERGLKLCIVIIIKHNVWSLPARGAWIEIQYLMAFFLFDHVAPRKGSVD